MFFRRLVRICLFAAIPSVTFVMGAQGQERSSGEVLTLDRAIELARANNRETKRAKFDIDKQREASAEARTFYYPRFDTYLLGTQLLGPLNFTIGAGQLGTYPSTGPIPGSDTQPAHSRSADRRSVDYSDATDYSDSTNPLFCR